MNANHQADAWNQCCTSCGQHFESMQKAFAKKSNVQQLITAFTEHESKLEELEDVRVVSFSTTYDKIEEVKYTNYEKIGGLRPQPSIIVTELVSIQGLYMFFHNWAKNEMEPTNGSTDPKQLIAFLVQTVLAHEEFRGTSIMYTGFTYSKKKIN
jgi:hypothetical protein